MTEIKKSDTISFSSKLEERVVFFFVAMGVITVTLGLFALVDFLPEKPTDESATQEEVEAISAASEVVSNEPLPLKIFIDSLDIEVAVHNPESNAIEVLDQALLSGVVRHPDSADLVNEGTVFILGHSSYLPNVINKNFKAFNGIQKLAWGDTVRLQSADMEYIYTVDRVYEAKASDAEVPLQYDIPKLVLATCNSFGTKDDRYIVEATLTTKRPL